MPDDFRKSTEVENFIVTAAPAVKIDRTPPALSREEEVGACSVSVVGTDSEFMMLESEWDSLLSTAEASVFQTFEWISSWWKYFGSGCRLNCLVFKTGDRIVGIAPLFKKDVRILGLGVATHLQFSLAPFRRLNRPNRKTKTSRLNRQFASVCYSGPMAAYIKALPVARIGII